MIGKVHDSLYISPRRETYKPQYIKSPRILQCKGRKTFHRPDRKELQRAWGRFTGLSIEEEWISEGVRLECTVRWLNEIVRKAPADQVANKVADSLYCKCRY